MVGQLIGMRLTHPTGASTVGARPPLDRLTFDFRTAHRQLTQRESAPTEGRPPVRATAQSPAEGKRIWDERESDIYFQKAVHRVRFTADVEPDFFVNVLRQSADSGAKPQAPQAPKNWLATRQD